MTATLFLILATLGLLSALGTVLSRNLVHAALYLVAFFFLVACLFVLLEAEFLAAAQVLIYIGAVAILLMFGIMLTRNVQGDETTAGPRGWRIPGAIVSLGLLAALVFGINRERGLPGRAAWTEVKVRPVVADRPEINDMAGSLGDELMGRYALPFEIAGLLLTAALVGSIALARQDGDDDDGPTDRARVVRSHASEPAEASS